MFIKQLEKETEALKNQTKRQLITQKRKNDMFLIGQTIVYADQDILVAWNGSATFNVFTRDGFGELTNIECFTQYNVETFNQAAGVVDVWLNDNGFAFEKQGVCDAKVYK